jgi:hypothetical protein
MVVVRALATQRAPPCTAEFSGAFFSQHCVMSWVAEAPLTLVSLFMMRILITELWCVRVAAPLCGVLRLGIERDDGRYNAWVPFSHHHHNPREVEVTLFSFCDPIDLPSLGLHRITHTVAPTPLPPYPPPSPVLSRSTATRTRKVCAYNLPLPPHYYTIRSLISSSFFHLCRSALARALQTSSSYRGLHSKDWPFFANGFHTPAAQGARGVGGSDGTLCCAGCNG